MNFGSSFRRGWRSLRLGGRADRRNFHRYLLLNGAQHVSRAGDVREVDLGFDFFFAVGGTRSSPCGTWHRVGAAAEVLSHQVRFVIFQGTGVRFLLRDAHRSQGVKNFLALDFQLTGQIVDSNLTHPLSFPLVLLISCI